MFWKIYFWFYTLFVIFAAYILLTTAPVAIADWIVSIATIILILPIYAFSYKKNMLNQGTWKMLFWASLIFWGLNILFEFFPQGIKSYFSFLQGQAKVTATGLFLSYVLIFPPFYSLYKLTLPKAHK